MDCTIIVKIYERFILSKKLNCSRLVTYCIKLELGNISFVEFRKAPAIPDLRDMRLKIAFFNKSSHAHISTFFRVRVIPVQISSLVISGISR